MNLVEKAEKVIKFKMLVTTECASRNMRIPSADKISEYINGGYPMDLKSFMADYTHFEGVFRRPLREVSPLEEELLKATLELSENTLQGLWNIYVEERYSANVCALRGNVILRLDSENHISYIRRVVSQEEFFRACRLAEDHKYAMIGEDGKIRPYKSLKTLIENNWEEIFERIMLFPDVYGKLYVQGDFDYLAAIVIPTMQKLLGFDINVDESLVTYKGEK